MLFRLSALCACTAGFLLAQAPPPPAPTVVEGKVTNSITGEKLKKVNVRLQPFGGSGAPTAVLSDAEGVFRFEGVEPGSYRLMADKPGFLMTQYGARRVYSAGTVLKLVAGQKLTGLILPVVPQAAMSGHILDEDGDPLGRAFVRVLRAGYSRGKRQWIPAAGTSSDANGEFKTSSLAPGKYYVVAQTSPMAFGGTSTAANKPGQPEESYVETYYPSSLDQDGATAIDVLPGREIPSIDIRMRKARTYHVRGKVVGGSAQNLSVRIAGRENSMGMMSSTMGRLKDDGSFDVPGVRPGSYNLILSNSMGMMQSLGMAPIEVANGDLNDVSLGYVPAQTLAGQIKIEGDAGTVKLSTLRVFFNSETAGSFVQPPTVKEDGSFTVENAAAGKYSMFVNGSLGNGYVKSVRWGERESVDGTVDLSTGAGSAPLTITISTAGGQLAGSVSTDRPASVDQSKAQAIGTVVLIPDPPQPQQQSLYKVSNLDQSGQFNFSGIKPGQYKVFAWEDIESGAWTDPDVVKPYDSKSVKVTVSENSKASITVPLISAEASGEQKAGSVQ